MVVKKDLVLLTTLTIPVYFMGIEGLSDPEVGEVTVLVESISCFNELDNEELEEIKNCAWTKLVQAFIEKGGVDPKKHFEFDSFDAVGNVVYSKIKQQ